MKERVIKVNGINVLPIPIRENGQNHLFKLFEEPSWLEREMLETTETVFEFMKKEGLATVDERRAIWRCWNYFGENCEKSFREKIGTTFPTIDFGEKCKLFSAEKVIRTYHKGLICSHQKRNPQERRFGGSARLVFRLIPRKGESKLVTCIGAVSGQKEWEDLVIELLTYHYLRLIKFKDRQVQEILAAADLSVQSGSIDFSPGDMSICHFTKICFNALDREFPDR